MIQLNTIVKDKDMQSGDVFYSDNANMGYVIYKKDALWHWQFIDKYEGPVGYGSETSYPTRKAAIRAAKRDCKITMSQDEYSQKEILRKIFLNQYV